MSSLSDVATGTLAGQRAEKLTSSRTLAAGAGPYAQREAPHTS